MSKTMTTAERRQYYERLTVLGVRNYLAHETERRPRNWAEIGLIKRVLNQKQKALSSLQTR